MSRDIEKLVENINVLMREKGVANFTELAKNTKIPQPTMHRLVSGDIKDPKYTLLKNIADFFKVSVDELVESSLKHNREHNNADTTISSVNFKKIPVVGGAQLGNGGYWQDFQYPVGFGDGFVNWPSDDPDAFALRCKGDSMKPRIKNGEYVIIEPNHTYLPGDEVLVISKQEEVMIKTFLYERDEEIMVMSINEEHPPLRFSADDIEHLYYVAGIAKPSLYNCI
ncbi:S24 family peptidase [Providencia manganoxydans]|uniref:S24 family peptidase n=1 Tax=Providencia manganoxydans TaxID=2923283 RepID=UPI0032DA0054